MAVSALAATPQAVNPLATGSRPAVSGVPGASRRPPPRVAPAVTVSPVPLASETRRSRPFRAPEGEIH